jgi:hypothetical protein
MRYIFPVLIALLMAVTIPATAEAVTYGPPHLDSILVVAVDDAPPAEAPAAEEAPAPAEKAPAAVAEEKSSFFENPDIFFAILSFGAIIVGFLWRFLKSRVEWMKKITDKTELDEIFEAAADEVKDMAMPLLKTLVEKGINKLKASAKKGRTGE